MGIFSFSENTDGVVFVMMKPSGIHIHTPTPRLCVFMYMRTVHRLHSLASRPLTILFTLCLRAHSEPKFYTIKMVCRFERSGRQRLQLMLHNVEYIPHFYSHIKVQPPLSSLAVPPDC